MDESILDYIKQSYTLEMQEILLDALRLLDRLNIQTYEGYILNTLNNAENEDSEFVSSNITSYIEGMFINLERAFGFRLQEYGTMTLEQRVKVVRGYVEIEDYIDHEAMIRICETDMNDVEKFAEAVALTSEFGAETLMSFVEWIDEAAVETIQRLHLRETPAEEKMEEVQLPEASPEQITQIKAYELFIKEHNLTVDCFQLIRMGFPIGAPFKLYWDQFKDIILQADTVTLSKETIGLFLLSKEHWGNPLLAFTNLSEELFDSINVITEVNMSVRRLLSGFVKFKAENKIK
jgi:hypothetical protein